MAAFVLQRVTGVGPGEHHQLRAAAADHGVGGATNFQPPISNGGRIDVVEEGTASGFVPPACDLCAGGEGMGATRLSGEAAPTNPWLARREVTPIRAATVVGGEFLAARRHDSIRRRTT